MPYQCFQCLVFELLARCGLDNMCIPYIYLYAEVWPSISSTRATTASAGPTLQRPPVDRKTTAIFRLVSFLPLQYIYIYIIYIIYIYIIYIYYIYILYIYIYYIYIVELVPAFVDVAERLKMTWICKFSGHHWRDGRMRGAPGPIFFVWVITGFRPSRLSRPFNFGVSLLFHSVHLIYLIKWWLDDDGPSDGPSKIACVIGYPWHQ